MARKNRNGGRKTDKAGRPQTGQKRDYPGASRLELPEDFTRSESTRRDRSTIPATLAHHPPVSQPDSSTHVVSTRKLAKNLRPKMNHFTPVNESDKDVGGHVGQLEAPLRLFEKEVLAAIGISFAQGQMNFGIKSFNKPTSAFYIVNRMVFAKMDRLRFLPEYREPEEVHRATRVATYARMREAADNQHQWDEREQFMLSRRSRATRSVVAVQKPPEKGGNYQKDQGYAETPIIRVMSIAELGAPIMREMHKSFQSASSFAQACRGANELQKELVVFWDMRDDFPGVELSGIVHVRHMDEAFDYSVAFAQELRFLEMIRDHGGSVKVLHLHKLAFLSTHTIKLIVQACPRLQLISIDQCPTLHLGHLLELQSIIQDERNARKAYNRRLVKQEPADKNLAPQPDDNTRLPGVDSIALNLGRKMKETQLAFDFYPRSYEEPSAYSTNREWCQPRLEHFFLTPRDPKFYTDLAVFQTLYMYMNPIPTEQTEQGNQGDQDDEHTQVTEDETDAPLVEDGEYDPILRHGSALRGFLHRCPFPEEAVSMFLAVAKEHREKKKRGQELTAEDWLALYVATQGTFGAAVKLCVRHTHGNYNNSGRGHRCFFADHVDGDRKCQGCRREVPVIFYAYTGGGTRCSFCKLVNELESQNTGRALYKGLVARCLVNVLDAQADEGYRPATSLDEALQQTGQHLQRTMRLDRRSGLWQPLASRQQLLLKAVGEMVWKYNPVRGDPMYPWLAVSAQARHELCTQPHAFPLANELVWVLQQERRIDLAKGLGEFVLQRRGAGGRALEPCDPPAAGPDGKPATISKRLEQRWGRQPIGLDREIHDVQEMPRRQGIFTQVNEENNAPHWGALLEAEASNGRVPAYPHVPEPGFVQQDPLRPCHPAREEDKW